MAGTLEAYIHQWHLLKLRKLEARRMIFSKRSLFQFEYSCLQLRKIIEGIAQTWILAAEANGIHVSEKLKLARNPSSIYNYLVKAKSFDFPSMGRLETKQNVNTVNQIHFLKLNEDGSDFAFGLIKEYENLHSWLHSFSPYQSYPVPKELDDYLIINYRNLGGAHQRIWNYYWSHFLRVGEHWMFISLNSDKDLDPPHVMRVESIPFEIGLSQLKAPIEVIAGWESAPVWGDLSDKI